ncbi:ribonuclease HI family protein [Diaphorobacter sp. HDW4A]|uniref:ribonuclease HI family protein n=1 Tax=Diaphorobacter sp. HDW4A TaxID=2714924 RepID=UPI001F0EE379|nr:ribonuclease HI family protein [Diaphorobacter sp. HDW4A]
MDSQTWMVFIDGSALPNPGKLGIGGVVYAPDGCVDAFSVPLPRIGCNNEAEARAAIHAFEWLLAKKARHVWMYTDNSILAAQLSLAEPKQIERLAAVYDKARTLAKRFDSMRVSWIPRHKNPIADALARGDWEGAGFGAVEATALA